MTHLLISIGLLEFFLFLELPCRKLVAGRCS